MAAHLTRELSPPNCMKIRLLSFACLAVTAGTSSAAYIFTGANFSISEDFNGMGTGNVVNFLSATPGVQSAVPGTGFVAAKLSGTGTTATSLAADAGTGTAGTVYNYGTTAAADRALGLLASAGVIASVGFELQNAVGSGQVITSLTISFTQENWRSSTSVQNVHTAGYGTSDTGVVASSFISTATGISPAAGLNLTGPAPVTTNGALDGNLLANQASRTVTITGLTIDPGESFFIRWQDVNDAGSDAGLALDSLSITITSVPEPSTMLMLAAAGVAVLQRRRRR